MCNCPSQPVEPSKHHKGQSKCVEAVEAVLKHREAELDEGVHDEGVGVAAHGLHVQHEMLPGDHTQHVECEDHHDHMAKDHNDVTRQEGLPLVGAPLRPEALGDLKVCGKGADVQ